MLLRRVIKHVKQQSLRVECQSGMENGLHDRAE